jgi:hypothetical protein
LLLGIVFFAEYNNTSTIMGAGAGIEGIDPGFDEESFNGILADLASKALFKKLRGSDGKVSREKLIKFSLTVTDIFLTHDWGKDELGRDNHSRVAKINAGLRGKGLKTWFDEEEMKGRRVRQQMMSDGIDSARCVIVFVTDRYIDKVAGKGADGDKDNCLYEFSYSVRTKGPNKMVAVVQEKCCADTTQWHGQVGGDLGGETLR